MYTYNEALAIRGRKGRQEGLEEGLLKGFRKGRQEGRQEGRLEGRQEGFLKGAVRGLVNEFLAYGRLSPLSVSGIRKQSISLSLIREVWEQQKELLDKTEPMDRDKSVDVFIGLLNQEGIFKV